MCDNIIIETKIVPEEFVPVYDVSVSVQHKDGPIRIKLVRLYIEGLRDADALNVDLPISLENFMSFIESNCKNK